ncbi:fibronectin type III domain-containing protein, partial [Flavobacterium cerinum]
MKRKITFLSCRCILIAFILFAATFRVCGQSVTNYTFAGTTAGGFTPISGGSTTTWTGSTDDGASALIPIGFDFWYMGTRYTTISASTNGWLSLGSVPTDYVYTNSLSASGSPRPVIAPLWDDLDIVSTANVTYKTAGTAGNRVFTIQYLNVEWNYLAIGAVCSFQVNLYETTGKVEFIYRSDTFAANLASASIGITAAATGSGNYLSVNNAGTSTSSTSEASITTKRVTGRTYGFTSPIPTAPGSLSFTAVSLSSMTLNWTDLSSNERGFAIYRSTDGINYSFVSQVVAGATSSLQTGLNTGTTYYWKVYAVTEGGMSSSLNGTQATSCNGPIISQLPATNLISYYKFEGNAVDATANNSGTFQGGTPTASADRFNVAAKAYTFNGSSNYISTSTAYVNPASVSVSSWFKTTTTVGGVLMGFSSLQTGGNGNRDRFIYMTSTGILYFGVAPGAVKKYINTTTAYNDGNWHLVTATLGASGMKLYVDGVLSASDLSVTTAETITGYWRLGHSDISTWPNEPSSYYFQGTLDDMVVYHRELSAAEIGVLYNSPDGAGSNSPVCSGASLNLTATTVASASYSWTGPNGFTSSLQNPILTYSAVNAGIYTVQVTIPGCAAPTTAYTNVVSTTASGQWTGNVSTDWANAANWCNGTLPTATTDVIIGAGATRMPNISTSVSCRNLTINSGASITLTGTLNIAGTLTNSGTFTNTGTINFNGTTGQQTFSGLTSFYNVTLNNSNGLLLPSAITITNDLTITAGTLNANNFNVTITGNWTNNSSATAFTAGTGTVTFNSSTAKSIGGTFSTTFNNLIIANIGNTISLAINTSITGNLSVNTGTFDLGAFTANRATAGGILTVANNATLKIGGNNTYPSNYGTNTLVTASTVEYSGTNQAVANQVYGNLRLTSSSGAAVKTFPATALSIIGNLTSALGAGTSVAFTAASAITINGNVAIGASTTFNGGSFSHNIGGNWSNSGTFNGNTGTVIFTGSGTTVSGSGVQNFNSVTVAASMVSFSAEGLSLSGNLATTGAGSFTQASGGTLTMTGTGTTISGVSIAPDNLIISGTVTTTSSIVLTGNLTVSGSFIASTGTIIMSGTSKTISGAGTKTFYILSLTGTVTTAVSFNISSGLLVYGSLTASAGTVTFTGTSSLSGTANLFNVTINGTSLQLSANAILGIAGTLTVTAGTLNVSSTPNTVNFNGSGAQSINALTYNNLITSNAGNKTAAGAITVNNDITIGSGTTFIAGSFTHSIYNNWYNNGSFTPGTSTVQILGSQNSVISGATTFNILTLNNTSSAITLTLLSNVSVATVNMITGTMLTGANTITITTTRTGNGIILGTITRNHAFGLLLSGYAFEGPDNIVSFTVALGVNSVTVSVATNPPGDFPFNGSINRMYTISIPNGIGVLGTIRFHYEDNELNGNNESTMTVWRNSGTTWSSSGKTANNTTNNYVEVGLPGAGTNRWTLSDNANVVQWNGSVSSDWNTANNWTVVQGSASRPPAATDVANIGTVAFTNQPTISTAVNVKNINFGSVQAATLTMAAGGSLVASDIKGSWSTNATHTINVNGQTVTVNGDLTLSDGTSGHAINLNIGSGTVSIAGTLTQNGNANIIFTGAGNLNIAGDFNYTNGVFTPGSGTVTYNGSANQNVGIVNYNNLTVNKTAANAIATSGLTIGGNLTITAGEFDSNGVSTITGNVNIASGTTFQNNSTVSVGGNWNNNGSFTSNNSETSVVFNGTGAQSISATTFNNLEFNKPIGTIATLTGNVTIKGNLTGTSGTLDIQSFVFNRDVQGGTATLSDAGTLIIAADNAPTRFANYALSTNSTVIFNGTGTQNLQLPGVVYGNIIFRNAGTKILYTPITVKNDLTIENTAVFNGGANTITVNGNWTNSGTYVPATSTLLFTGTTKNITGNTTFNQVTVTGSYTILNDVTFNGLLNITSSGALSGGASINTTLNADLTNSGTLNTLGSTTFTGNVLQTLSLINAVSTVAMTVNFNGSVSPVLNSTSPPQFGYLNINNTGGVNASVGWTILYTLTVGNGASFNAGTSTHNLQGALTNNGIITSAGTLNFIPTTTVTLNMGTNFSSTGLVVFGGAGAITLSGTPGSLKDVLISNTNVAGITSVSNLTITNNFTINTGSVFNAGSYSYSLAGNLLNNGTLNSGTSTFTLNGTAIQDIYSVSPLYKLTLNNSGGTVTLSSNVTVNNALTFTTGKIQTGNNILIQPVTGSVSGAAQNTGWVYGRLQKNTGTGAVTKTFEIGNALNYLPVTVSFANVSTSGNLTVSTIEGDQPSVSNSIIDPAKSVNRYWTISNSGIVFTTANITFNYLAADVDPGASTNAFVLGEYGNSSWSYPMGNSLTPTSFAVTGITYFADFQIGQRAISIKTWDGGAGTSNWGDAANWNTDGVPTVNDNVELTGAYIINVNIPAVTKNLLLSNSGLVLSTIGANTLSVSGNLILASGTLNIASAFPSVTGSADVSAGTVGFTGTGSQTIPVYNYYNLVSSSSGARIFGSPGTIGIANAFTPGTNSYTVTGSTVSYNGAGGQTIAASVYNNLSLDNAGTKTFATGIISVAGSLTYANTITPDALSGSGTISYNGTSDQTIADMNYYNLDAANPSGIVTLHDVTVNMVFSVTKGTVHIGSTNDERKINIYDDITVASGATLTVSPSSDVKHSVNIAGDIVNNGTLDMTSDVNSLAGVNFIRDGNQTISGSGISDFHEITVNQGSSNLNTLTVTTAGFVVPNGF